MIERDVGLVEIAERAGAVRIIRGHEAIVEAAVVLRVDGLPAMGDVFDAVLGRVEGLDGRAGRVGVARALGDAVHPRHGAEIVVEAAVLHHQQDEVIDGDGVAEGDLLAQRLARRGAPLEGASRAQWLEIGLGGPGLSASTARA